MAKRYLALFVAGIIFLVAALGSTVYAWNALKYQKKGEIGAVGQENHLKIVAQLFHS